MKAWTIISLMLFTIIISSACSAFSLTGANPVQMCPCNLTETSITIKNTGLAQAGYYVTQSGPSWATKTADFFTLMPGEEYSLVTFLNPGCNKLGNYELSTRIAETSGEIKTAEQTISIKSCAKATPAGKPLAKIIKPLLLAILLLIVVMDVILAIFLLLRPSKRQIEIYHRSTYPKQKDQAPSYQAPTYKQPAIFDAEPPKRDSSFIRTLVLVGSVVLIVIFAYLLFRRLPQQGNLITTYLPKANLTAVSLDIAAVSPYVLYALAGIVVLIAVIAILRLLRARPSTYYEPAAQEPRPIEFKEVPYRKILVAIGLILLLLAVVFLAFKYHPTMPGFAARNATNSIDLPDTPRVQGGSSGIRFRINDSAEPSNKTLMERYVGSTQPGNETILDALGQDESLVAKAAQYIRLYWIYAALGAVLTGLIIFALRSRDN